MLSNESLFVRCWN